MLKFSIYLHRRVFVMDMGLVAPENKYFPTKKYIVSFLITPQKHMLWVLISKAHMFCAEKSKTIYVDAPLVCSNTIYLIT